MGARVGVMTTRPIALVVLIVGVSLARIVYLAWWCPYTLIEDEAHYWEWSRRFDWSYYTKGPGIALLIRASVEILGLLGAGVSEFVVRFPAVVASAVLCACVAGLAKDMTGQWRAGFFAAALVLLAPAHQGLALLMTIDGPYLACWAAAAWAGYRALAMRSRWAWVWLGAAVGVGFLFKYTIVLLLPGIAWHAWTARAALAPAPGWRRFAPIGLLAAGLGFVPVLVWNARHEWHTIGHLLGHLGFGADAAAPEGGWRWSYDPLWTLELVGTQFLLLGVVSFVMAYTIVVAARRREGDAPAPAGWAYVLRCAIPVLAFYLAVSFATDTEGNWPLAGYTTLFPLAGWGVADALDARRRGFRAIHRVNAWWAAVVAGLIVGIGQLRLDLLSGLDWWQGSSPAGRLLHADELGRSADRVVQDLRDETGLEPFVAAEHYGRASVLAFYMTGRPVVFCADRYINGSPTAYDFWDDTDLDRPDLLGRPALLVGASEAKWSPAFERVVPIGVLDGDMKRGRAAFLGYGYRGFPAGESP
jgi:4-amino-4-deoxy-L-arabinose transferase-like glycosyltransferase